MAKGLEDLTHKEKLREPGCSAYKDKAQGDHIRVYRGEQTRQSQTLLGDRTGRRHRLKYRKFCLNIEKRGFIVKMEQVAQRSWGDPILKDTQNPAEGPEESVPAAPV